MRKAEADLENFPRPFAVRERKGRGNRDKRFNWCAAIPLFLALACFPARAQESAAQSLYGVKEILVRPITFDDTKTAGSCRLVSADLDALIMKELQDSGLPAVAESDARPSTIDIARIILVPQVVPFNSEGLDCITWVSLSAESRNHLRVLPVEIPRVVNVVYWHHGEMVVSAVSVHGDRVDASLHAMIQDLARHYQAAQPPKIGRPSGLEPQ